MKNLIVLPNTQDFRESVWGALTSLLVSGGYEVDGAAGNLVTGEEGTFLVSKVAGDRMGAIRGTITSEYIRLDVADPYFVCQPLVNILRSMGEAARVLQEI